MIIEFQLIGEKRKELAKTISEIIGAPAEYQFMPTCAYKIGDFYTVTKEGNLEICLLYTSSAAGLQGVCVGQPRSDWRDH